ncbi:hypothetical protein KAR28_01415 [Candidatus Parcubacteria bacterium]|nr:hypothetical protein [Candidatus Parcubacteria bacterium]
MTKTIKKKLSLPQLFGIILASLDLAFWVWFVIYGLTHARPGIFEEGLLGMMILHMPASVLLPILGSFILSPFLTSDSIVPQTIFLFAVGIAQYYFVGYFLGKAIVFLRRKLGYDKSIPKLKDASVQSMPSRKKILALNFLYLLFSLLAIQTVVSFIGEMLGNFEIFKENFLPIRHFIELLIAVAWLICTVKIYQYDRKFIGKNFDSNQKTHSEK